jgi:hypothetical protein
MPRGQPSGSLHRYDNRPSWRRADLDSTVTGFFSLGCSSPYGVSRDHDRASGYDRPPFFRLQKKDPLTLIRRAIA